MVTKDDFRKQFSREYKKNYEVKLFREEGFERGECDVCGKGFWSAGEGESCGDSAHTKYSFFKDKPLKETYASFWKKTADFWAKRGHEIIPRYPVICRWRDDLYFTIASIVDFQHVEGGQTKFEYPANPLYVPQMCLRFGDIANVGVTGRHLSCFMMSGQHSFNAPKEGYWKDECLQYNYEYLTQILGINKGEISYAEDVWTMPDFSTVGPCIESFAKGSELVNSVFTEYSWNEEKKKLEDSTMKVIDVGWGFDRLLWYYNGNPTVYDAVFPNEIAYMKKRASIELETDVFKHYTSLAATLDVESLHTFKAEKEKIARELGITIAELEKGIAPMQGIYAIGDHARTLLFALADGGLPSNTAGGYNLRVLLRRSLGFINEYGFDFGLYDLMEMHAKDLKNVFPELLENVEYAKPILEVEKRKYESTLVKARGVASQIVARNKPLSADEMATYYESSGLTPEILEKVAKEQGKEIAIPSEYYSRLTNKHVMDKKTEKVPAEIINLPKTKTTYYDTPFVFEGEAKVVYSKGTSVVLDHSLFYPEGGGQMNDEGWLDGVRVVNAQKHHGVIVLTLEKPHEFKVGAKVKMKVDEARRLAIMKHHTATHIVLNSATAILGPHVWQTGSRKDSDEAHVDVTHFERPSREQIEAIEKLANQRVLEGHPVTCKYWDRIEAERKFGFRVYQGGGAIAKQLRLVHVGDIDVEACGGTHVLNSKDLGFIKITSVDQIQDGVIRFYYKAGPAALAHTQQMERTIEDTAAAIHTTPTHLLSATLKMVEEWKERGKKLEKRDAELADGYADKLVREHAKDLFVQAENLDFEASLLEKMAGRIATNNGFACLLRNREGFVVAAAHAESQRNAIDLLKATGAKGGGNVQFARGKITE